MILNRAYTAGNGLLTDLQSYWKLDEASGTLYDAHGSNDGTSAGGLTYGATGKDGDCVHFDGTDDRVDFGTGLDFSGHSGITISMWINIDAFPTSGNWGYLYANAKDGSNTQIILELKNEGGTQRLQGGTNGTNFQLPYYNHSMSTGTWYNVMITHDGSRFRLYLDGTNVETGLFGSTGSINTNSDKNLIGAWWNGTSYSRHVDGKIDEVAVWFRELDATDRTNVQTLFYDDFTS